MKLKYLCIALATAVLGVTGCQPDEYSLGGSAYTADDLVQGFAYSVTPDAENGNIIHLKSLVSGVTPQWILTDGSTSQKSSIDLNLPFAGTYTVTFGVSSAAGVIYGDPCEFTIEGNDFSMLSDPKWGYLAGGVGKTKTWVPLDKDYGVGQTVGPMTYCNPDDVLNDGSAKTDLAFEAWKPNWDPGIQSWLFLNSDPEPYIKGSSMTFGLDAAKGCTFELVRGDDNTTASGAFTLNLDDESHPTIAFSGGGYVLHMSNFDEACSNYTGAGDPLKIVELTPYVLQIATMRTNAEGSWWLVWSFIAKDVQDGLVEIPVEATDLAKTDVPEIDDQNLATNLFTISTDDNGDVLAQTVTFLSNTDQPYGFYWWNGGTNAAWEFSAEDDYGKAWYPEVSNEVSEFALTLTKATDQAYDGTFEEESSGESGYFTISGNTLKFYADKELKTDMALLFTKTKETGYDVNSNELTVVKADYSNNVFYFALPFETNEKGMTSKFICANLTQKSIGSAQTGPKTITVDQSKVLWNFGDTGGKNIRISIFNTYNSSDDPAVNVKDMKIKNGQTMTVKFKITSGITWKDGAAPKAVACFNTAGFGPGTTWDDYTVASAVTVNKTGETTLTIKNESGSKVDLSSATMQISLQIDSNNKTGNDLCTIDLDEEGNPKITGEVYITIE